MFVCLFVCRRCVSFRFLNLGFDVLRFGLVFPFSLAFIYSCFLPITVILKAGLVDMAESSLPFPYTLSPQDVRKRPDLPLKTDRIVDT